MPLFSTKPKEVSYSWTFDITRLATPHDPAFPHLEAAANSELNKIRDFVAYKGMQNQQSKNDLTALSHRTGRIILPPIRQKINADKTPHSLMSPYVGHDWPSLRHDFGVRAPDGDARSAEYRIDYETEKAACLPSLVPHYKQFEKLGFSADEFTDLLVDMIQTEKDLENKQTNPPPRNKFGRLEKVDFDGAQLRMRNIFRFRFQYNFNKIADEQGAYLHIRFENQNQYAGNRSAFNQDLVFVFPTSNEERDIWRHVFWNEEYPAAGFPVQTTYARQLAEIENPSRSSGNHVDKLAAEFSRMAMPAQASPPSYDSTFSQRQ